MSYQSIVDIIRDTANGVNPNGTFIHGRRSDVTLHHDKPMPQIFLLPPNTRTDRQNDSERHTITMGFFRQDSLDSSVEEMEAIIAEMDELSRSFMGVLTDKKTLMIQSEYKTPEYRQFAGTMSGYGLTFEVIAKIEC